MKLDITPRVDRDSYAMLDACGGLVLIVVSGVGAQAAAAAIQRHDDIVASLRAVLPYAESRAEDMAEEDAATDLNHMSDATRKAIAAVDAAKALLASLDTEGLTHG